MTPLAPVAAPVANCVRKAAYVGLLNAIWDGDPC